MDSFDKIVLSQLDKQVDRFKPLLFFQPKGGWIKKCRTALKMSTYALAQRLGVSQPSICELEKRESQGRISVKKLEEAAKSFGCRFVYAFVPEDTFSQFVETEYKKIAQTLVDSVQKTMHLEGQALTKRQKEEQVQFLVEDIKSQPLKKLWDQE